MLDEIITTTASTAAAAVIALTVLQTDRASRAFLSPERLQGKRRREYEYRWANCIEKSKLQVDYYLSGGVAHHSEAQEQYAINPVIDDVEMQSLIKALFDSKESKIHILKIDQDEQNDPSGKLYLFLLIVSEETGQEVIQVPLVTFGKHLQTIFDKTVATTTLCFVADASSGGATQLIENLAVEAKTDIAVVSEPCWLATLGSLNDDKLLLSNDEIQQLVFVLCRLEAWNVRKEVATSRTVLISLPGQATTTTLLPLVQAAFPEDRHVFCYDGCASSVQRGLQALQSYKRGSLRTTLKEVRSLSYDPTRHTIPFGRRPLTDRTRHLSSALGELPISIAQIVEAWMSSVDTFFQLKDDEKTNGYLPYVFKYDMLTANNPDFAFQSGSYWSLCSLLQFVTGCRSRPLSDNAIRAAATYLKKFNATAVTPPKPYLSESHKKAIENCVFKHKSILIGDKTLQDTVLPRQHWTLKQARKAGCSCCGPEPDDEEETADKPSASSASPFALGGAKDDKDNSSPSNPGYVDGKLGFAFDPSRFS